MSDYGRGPVVAESRSPIRYASPKRSERIFRHGTLDYRLLADGEVDFTCPGLLGTYNQFAKHYEKPIMKSRTPGCPATALEDGRMRAEEVC